jgi:hypothetical protein
MRFRRESIVQGLDAVDEADWQIDLGTEHGIILRFQEDTFRARDAEGYEEDLSYLRISAQGNWQLDSQTEQAFHSFKGGKVLFVPSVPVAGQRTVRSIDHELLEAASCVTNLVRWRFGVHGHNEPFSKSGLEWQAADGEWKGVAYSRSIRLWFGATANFQEQIVDELTPLVFNGWREPLGHSLLREAWDLRETNPRSALVIGVAAAEVGFKHFAVEMAPQTAWLVEELQAPPLEKLMRKYLPILLKDRDEVVKS